MALAHLFVAMSYIKYFVLLLDGACTTIHNPAPTSMTLTFKLDESSGLDNTVEQAVVIHRVSSNIVDFIMTLLLDDRMF
jgi:hypothetical protein